jgi:myo-inositol-1(or 4)-monophosphatase
MARSALMNVMAQAILKTGRAMRRDFGEVEQLQVSIKGPEDFVSEADRKAEEMLHAELSRARPDYGFLFEEGGDIEGRDRMHRFIVDPLDGTTNFLHGIPHFAISVALEKAGQIIAAAIYNPITDEFFNAERGRGAYLNDRRLRVSGRKLLREAVIGCGIPHIGRGDHPRFRKELESIQGQVAGIRRFGAASLDLAYIAAGRMDGFWERDLAAWDMAAGVLMVREAGGFVSDLTGGDDMLSKGHILAANDSLHRDLLPFLKTR